MVVGAQVTGVLELVGARVRELSDEAVDALETMTTHAGTAIEAARVHQQTSEMAMTDALTGLRNRRRLNLDLAEECAASARYRRPLAFMMIDIDFFKSYNDSYGHQAGDAAIRAVADTLLDSLRSTDHAYRYGGEEFALVLRETKAADATKFAERLRGLVEQRLGTSGQLRPVTISIGVASLPAHGPSPDSLVAAADSALYQAKGSGRNRVVGAALPLSLATKPLAREDQPAGLA